jgi:thiamine-phosphate pyrophosphorylase
LILDQDILRVRPEQAMLQALAGGIRFFQYRNKSGPRRLIWETAFFLAQTARKSKALFIVNDHADIAMAVDADGVHLGQDDLPIEEARKIIGWEKVIGISTHSREQASDAERAGADYIGFGPVFSTTTKAAGAVQGIENLKIIRQTVKTPIIAIGGINHANAAAVIGSGAYGVAVISAILSAYNLQQAAGEMIRILARAGTGNTEVGGG